MGALNVFEYAAKHRVRFPYKGMIATEDLYTLSRSDLDAIYKTLNRARKANEEESLLTEQTKENILLEVQLKIVKHIFEEKQQRVLNAQAEKERAEKKQKILALIAEKDDAELRSKSKEELLKMAEDL